MTVTNAEKRVYGVLAGALGLVVWGYGFSALAAGEQAGVAAAVRGEVQIVSLADPVGHQVAGGEAVFLGDEINSGPDSGLQVLLLDQTVFTIGPDSTLSIDEFVYDPASGAGKLTAEVTKGTFRFITGKISAKKPENTVVKVPNGIIGVRGTIAAGRISPSESLIVLLGPGKSNNAHERIGEISLTNGGKEVLISRTGWGSTIGADGIPTTPVEIPIEQLSAIMGSLEKGPPPAAKKEANGDGDGGGGKGAQKGASAKQLSGQDNVEASHKSLGVLAAQLIQDDQTDVISETEQTSNSSGNANGITTLGELQALSTIETGKYFFHSNGAAFTQTAGDPDCPCVGTMTVKFNVDLGARTVGGGTSGIAIDTTGALGNINDSVTINPLSYASNASGDHVFDGNAGTLLTGEWDPSDFTGANPTFFDHTTTTIYNVGGDVATKVVFDVVYDTGGGVTGSGSTSMDRAGGSAP